MGEQLKTMGIKNIGPVSEQWLKEVGIHSYKELDEMGSVVAYVKIKQLNPKTSIVLLYALEAALWDIHWNELPVEVKERIKREANDILKPKISP